MVDSKTFAVHFNVKNENQPQTSNTLQEESSEEELDTSSSTRKRRKKINKQWQKETVFENKESAEQAVNSEKVWSFYHKNVDKYGNVSYVYRCNKVKYRGEQCQAGIYLCYPSHSMEVILYRSQLPHSCDKISTKSKRKILEDVKIEIKNLIEFDPRLKPKRILEILEEKRLELPSITDLRNYLKSLKKQKL